MCLAHKRAPAPAAQLTSMFRDLRVFYWNIHGWKSKCIENKLEDVDFIEHIQDYEIICLS